MKKKRLDKLFGLCQQRDINISLTWQKMTGWSVEIYIGYTHSYKKLFYTDGHISKKKALKDGIKFMKELDKKSYYSPDDGFVGHEVKPKKESFATKFEKWGSYKKTGKL